MVLALPELVVDQTRVLLPHRDPRIDLLPPQSFHGPRATAGILRDPHPQPVRLRGRTKACQIDRPGSLEDLELERVSRLTLARTYLYSEAHHYVCE